MFHQRNDIIQVDFSSMQGPVHASVLEHSNLWKRHSARSNKCVVAAGPQIGQRLIQDESLYKCISESEEKGDLMSSTTRRHLLKQAAGLSMLSCCCSSCLGTNEAFAVPEAVGTGTFMDKLFANAMDQGMKGYEEQIRPVKDQLFSELNNSLANIPQNHRILEIGCGTGPNVGYYNPQSVVIEALDPNEYMRPYLEQNMIDAGYSPDRLKWTRGVAESLPFEDSSMDAIVCTLTLCSVRDVDAAVQEAFRVLRPGGLFLFIEHVQADDSLLRIAQDVCTPLQKLLADGCHLNRNPVPSILKAGFSSEEKILKFSVDTIGLLSPHRAGLLTKV